MQRLSYLIVFVLLGAVVMLFIKVQELQGALKAGSPKAEEEHVEVAEYMGRIHTYAAKLWAAGVAGNMELAEFYRHEIEEVMEELEAKQVIDDGVDISRNLRSYGLPSIEALGERMRSDGLGGFGEHYLSLLENCNACHAASGHVQIRVVAPTAAPQGQDFAPVK